MNRFASLILALSVSASAHAATSELRVLLDLDNNPTTGCSSNAFNGAEQRIVTNVETTAPAHVISVTRSTCSVGSFGAPVTESSGGWGVSLNSVTGQAVVETTIALSGLTVPFRIGYAIGSAAAVQCTYTRLGERRRAVGRPASGPPITLDGNTGDWAGISPLCTSASGTFFVLETSSALFFRFDGRLGAGPRANDDSFAARQGQVTSISAPGVLGNDVEPNGQPMTATVATQPANGTVSMQPDGSFFYSQNGSSILSDTFTYTASSSSGASNPANVTMNISLNAAPVATNDAYTVAEGGTLNVAAPGVLGNDFDPDTPTGLTASVVNNPTRGTLSLNANGSFTYVHNGSETTTDSFTYRVSDGLSFATAVVTITITPVNDPPVAIANAYTTSEETLLTVVAPGVLGNDTDPDSAVLTAAVVTNTTNGVLTFAANGSFTYMPNANFFGTDSFTYRANDGLVPSTLAATVTITVTPVNDPPSFTAGPNVTVAEDSAAFSAAWATAISSGPNETDPLTFNVTNNNNALFSAQPAISATGVLTFTPAPNANGTATVTVSLSDGIVSTTPITFTITVTAVNDPPSFTAGGNVTAFEDSGLYSAAQATAMSAGPPDEAGQTLTFNVSNNNNALFSVQPAIASNGTLTFTTAANAFGTATVTVTLSDNGTPVATSAAQTFTITLTAVNDVPSFTSGPNVSTPEDTPFSAAWATAISAGPNEAGQVVDFIVSNNNNALFSAQPAVSPTGVLTFTPALNASGTATVTVQIHDNGGTANGGVDTSLAQTFTITVNAVDDPPVVTTTPGSSTFSEGGSAVVIDGGVAVTDIDSPNLASATVAITNYLQPGLELLSATLTGAITSSFNNVTGTLTLTGPGTLANFQQVLRSVTYNNSSTSPSGTPRSIAFVANDGTSNSNTATKAVTIVSMNSAPVVTTSVGTTAFTENGPAVVIDNAITVTDADTPTLASATVTISNLLDIGAETLAATTAGSITANYVAPALTLSGTDTLANYQTVLRSITYNNTSNTPNTTNRTISFQVNDGDATNNLSNIATKLVSVAAANDAPVVTTTVGSSTFTEGGGAVAIDNGVTVTDPDNTTLASATVTISNLFNGGNELLAAATGGTLITASYVAPTLTLTGVDSLANYQTVLRSVTYNNTSNAPNTTARLIQFVANDGAVNSNTATKNVTVVSVNSAPVVTTSVGTTAFIEDSPAVAIDSALTVTDVDSTNLASATVTITNLIDTGFETLAAPTLLGAATASYVAPALTISGAATVAQYETMLRAVTYNNTHNHPDTTNRSISFLVNDGTDPSNSATKLVSVARTNDAPTANAAGPFTGQASIGIVFPAATLGGTDVEPGTTVTINTTPVAQTNGTVTLNADGSFTFTPLPTATSASFQYRVCDDGAPAPGVCSTAVTVNFPTVNGPAIYFVKSVATGAGNCTLNNECTLATALGQIGVTPNRRIFIGDNGTYSDAVALNAQGWIIGQGVTSIPTFDGLFGIGTPPAGTLVPRPSLAQTHPTLSNTLTVNASTVVRGLNVSTNIVPAVTDNSLGAINDVIVTDGSISGTTAPALVFSDVTTVAVNVSALSSSTSPVSGVILTNVTGNVIAGNTSAITNPAFAAMAISGGTVGVTYSGNISQANNFALLDVSSGHSGTLTFNTGTISATNGTGLQFNNADGTYNFNGTTTLNGGNAGVDIMTGSGGTFSFGANASITSPTGTAFNVNGSTPSVTFSGNITYATAGQRMIDITNVAGGSITFQTGTLSATNGTGILLSNADGAVNFNGTTTLNGGDAGVDVTTGSAGTFSFAETASITNPANQMVSIDASTSTFTYSGSLTKNNGSQSGINITNNTGGTISFNGDSVGLGADGAVETKALSTSAANAVNLTTNTGVTINFTGGGLVLTTTSGKGFTAAGGGIVNVSGTGNTISSTTGTALEVQNTNIGSSGLTLQSISSAGGSARGIVLDTTGSSGGLTVTGTGATDGSGGTITNKTGSDGATDGIGIYLNATNNVSLSNMILTDFQNYGIRGFNVSGFSMTNCDVTVSSFLTNGTNNAFDEGSVAFGSRAPASITGLTGTASIVDSTIAKGFEDSFSVVNFSGTLNLTINNCVIRDTSGNDGVIVEAHSTANHSVDVKNSQFIANVGDHFQATADDSAILDVKFGTNGGNTLTGGAPGALGQSVVIASGSFSGQVTFDVSNNSINGAIDTPINVNKGGGTGTFSGRIFNNTIGTTGVANSGTTGNKDAIRVVSNGAGTYTAAVTNNVLKQVSGNGIFGIARDGSSTYHVTITGNNLNEPAPGNNGIRIEAGALSSDTVQVCADIGGSGALMNTINGDWGAAIGADEIRLRHQFSSTTTFRLPGFAGGGVANVPPYLTGRNAGFPPATASATIAGVGAYTGGAACTQP